MARSAAVRIQKAFRIYSAKTTQSIEKMCTSEVTESKTSLSSATNTTRSTRSKQQKSRRRRNKKSKR
jgi:hypothetical protein